MGINRSSDSLGRCDPTLYSNIYDAKKRHEIRNEPSLASQPIHKDTIEISRDKLKEEALHRLRHTSKYVVAQQGFMRIGKYLFFGVALPLYMMVYGMPRWILIEGLPMVFSMCVWVWKKALHGTEKHFNSWAQRVVSRAQFIQRAMESLIRPLIHATLNVSVRIGRRGRHALRLFSTLMTKTRNAMIAFPALNLRKGLKQVLVGMLRIWETASQGGERVALRLQKGVEWLKNLPQVFLGWGQEQWHRFSQQTLLFRVQWKRHFQTSQQFAEQATDWVSRQSKKGFEAFKGYVEPFVAICYQKIQLGWAKIKERGRVKGKQARKFFDQKRQQLFASLHRKQEKLKRFSPQQWVDGLLSHRWMRKLPFRLQYWLKKCLLHPSVRRVFYGGIAFYSFLIRSLLQWMSNGLQMLFQTVAMTVKGWNRMRAFAKTSGQQLLPLWQIGRRGLRHSILRTLYYFLLCATIGIILLVWTFRSLGNSMNTLVPLKKRPWA